MAAFVEVVNQGSIPLRFTLNRTVTEVAPGVREVVDREAAQIILGNWDLRNYPPDDRKMFRREEYQRVRGLYGALPGGMYERYDDDGTRHKVNPDDLWEQRRPHVQVFEAGQPVTLVIDDPEGKNLGVEGSAELDKERMIQHLLDQQEIMTAQIEKLSAEVKADRHISATYPGAPEVNEDTPESPRAKRGRPPMQAAHDLTQ